MRRDIPDFFLEQYRIGEAPASMVELIESDPDALARVRELDADSDDILERYPSGWFVQLVRDQEADQRPRNDYRERRSFARQIGETVRGFFERPFLVPVVAFVVLGALLIPRMLSENTIFRSEDVNDQYATGERIKGLATELAVYRNDNDGTIETINEETPVDEGDQLQITYRAAGAQEGVIFSIDGRGMVTLHYPESIYDAATLLQDGEVALPYAYVLDDAPGFEQFFFVAGSDPIDPESVIEIAQEVADAEVNGSGIGADPSAPDSIVEVTGRLEARIAEETVTTDSEIEIVTLTVRKEER